MKCGFLEAAMKKRLRWRRLKGDYHVFNRGARRLRIFADDSDRSYFLRLLGTTARKHAVILTAWCLMDNHYHLGVRSDGARMGRMIRDLEKTYARYFNKKTGHVGALFEGRFGSVWLPDLEALAYVTRYIHSNCQDKGVSVELYPWSSYRAYLGLADAPFWLDTEPVLSWHGGRDAFARHQAEAPPSRPKVSEQDAAQEAFVEHIKDRVRRVFGEALRGKVALEAVVGWVALRGFELRPRVVAPLLGYSNGHCLSNVVSRLSRRMENDPCLKAALDQVLVK